jgi:hypothetical protein|tara:strand:+ start:101 stop:526 length:426 start_codon:yes stop_codon:yes gene_type:complete
MGRVFFNTRKNVVSLTESYQLLAGDSGSVFMLNAAAGLTVTLPAVADALDGWNCSIYIATNISSNTGIITEKTASDTDVIIAQFVELEVDTADDGPSSVGCTTLTFANALDTIGDNLHIVCDGSKYYVTGSTKLDGAVTAA